MFYFSTGFKIIFFLLANITLYVLRYCYCLCLLYFIFHR